MRMNRLFGSILALLFAVAISSPTAVAAQSGCGDTCTSCGWSSYEGTGDGDRWNGGCTYQSSGHCDFCLAPELVNDTRPDETAVAEAVRLADTADLSSLVADFGGYLRVHSERNLVVVTGLGCDPDAVGAVVFISPEKLAALKVLGIHAVEHTRFTT